MASISLVHSPHPLLPSVDRDIFEYEYSEPETVAGLLLRAELVNLAQNNNRPYMLLINDEVVPCEQWGRTLLKSGDVLYLRAAVAGGDNQDKNKTLRTMLIIALLIWAGDYYGAGTTAYTVAVVGGSLLINAMLPPRIPGLPSDEDENSPTYTISGGTNSFRHYAPMALVLGTHRVVPDLGAKTYSEIIGNDQYFNQAFHFGLSDITLSEHRVGDTLLTDYVDYEIEESAADGALTLFPGNVDVIAGGTIDVATDWVTRTSSVGASGLAVHIAGIMSYDIPDGAHKVRATLGIEYRKVGDVPWLPFIGAGETYILHGGRESFRWGHKINVADGQYEVRVRVVQYEWEYQKYHRQCLPVGSECDSWQEETVWYTTEYNVVAEDHGNLTVNLSWSALLTYQPDTPDYNYQKRLSLRIKATGQLNGQISNFNALATASAPVWNGSSWATGPTSNPAWWYLWLARGKFDASGQRLLGAGLPDSRIDIETIKAWGLWCDTKGLTCNLVFDRKMTVSQQLAVVARCGRATTTWGNGTLGIIYDKGGLPVTAMFGMSNIVRNSFNVEYVTGHLADEVVVEFINPDLNWMPDTVRATVPGVVSPVNPVNVKLTGCTDAVMAGKEANLIAAEQLYRRRFVSWDTDMEGLVVQRGDVVGLSHDLTSWGNSGRLVSGTTTQLTLPRKVLFEAGNTYYVGVRFPNGSYDIYDAQFYGPGETNVLTIINTPLPSAPDDDPDHPPLDYLWFFAPQPTPGKTVKIVSIKPASEHRVRITATDEDDEYYLAENNSYTHVPITPDGTTPSIVLLDVADTLLRAGMVFSTRIDLVWDVDGPYGGARVRAASSGQQLSEIGKTFDRHLSFPWDMTGIIDIELTVFNEAGEYGNGGRSTTTYEIQGKGRPPSDVAGFKAFQNGSTVSFVWNGSPDVDIQSTYIRREPKGRSGSFEDAIPVKDKKGVNTTTKDVPPGDWTFMAKHQDTSELWSPNAATYDLTVDNTQDVLSEVDYAPDWHGILIGCIRHWSGVLVPSSSSNNETIGWRVFDEVVPDPVDAMAFKGAEGDFDFFDTLRTSVTGSGLTVPLQTGEANPAFYIDTRQEFEGIKFDTFTEGSVTPLESHVSDSGGSWTGLQTTSLSVNATGEIYNEAGGAARTLGDENPTATNQGVKITGKPTSISNNGIRANARSNDAGDGYELDLAPVFYSGTNLARYSEQFDHTAWNKQRVTVEANAAIAPDGTLTADKIIADGTIDPYIQQLVAASIAEGDIFAESFWLCTDEGQPTSAALFLYGNDYSTDGMIIAKEITLTTAPVKYDLTITVPPGVTSTSLFIRFDLVADTNNPTAGDYLYAWGAQLIRDSVPGDYYKTEAYPAPLLFQWDLNRLNNFTVENLASGFLPGFSDDIDHDVEIRATDTTISGLIDGAQVASVEDTTVPGPGNVGFGLTGTDARITSLTAETNPYDGFEPWAIGNVNARYVKAQIDHDNLTHGPAIIDSFTLLVDMLDQAYKYTSIAVPAEGLTYNFPRQFHKPPFVTVQADSSLDLTIGRDNVTTTSVDLIVYQAGVAVAAVVDLIAEGA